MGEGRSLFKELPPFTERRFVPLDACLTDKDQLEGLYKAILARSVASPLELERWMEDLSELDAAVSQAASILYIEMTCKTDDPLKAKAYQDFVEHIEPVLKPIHDALNRRYLKLRETIALDEDRYLVHDRAVRTAVEMFVEKNVPLQTELALLSQEYQALFGAMTVDFDGKERTLPEMAKYLQEPDRPLRERAWRAAAERRLRDREKTEELFQKMMGLRHQIALNAGFKNFRDYQFKAYLRFDYSPDDCRKFHRMVKELVVPMRAAIDVKRRRDMGLERLRPWDVSVDPLGRPALKPFAAVGDLADGIGRIIASLDSELAKIFEEMKSRGLLDLESRKGKAPGGYQNTLDEARKPFIFMNAVGVDDDVRTLLHESGHAFHACLSAPQSISFYRHAPMEFSEVASMAMELMGNDGLKVFYKDGDARRSTIELLEGVISVLAWVATIDAFQHWLYENPLHSSDERRAEWVRIYDEFSGGAVDWSGLDDELAYLWHRQLHIFEMPFYYIEYGIAQLGALQVWQQFRKSPLDALANYKRALALGGSRPLPELFSTACVRFDFSKEMAGPLMEEVYREWQKLA